MQHDQKIDPDELLERCLTAFIQMGSIEVSLDQLAERVGVSKRMLIHYFGNRDNLEERAMALLEDHLRHQFAPSSFPSGTSLDTVISALWKRTTAPESRGVLLLVMDLTRRAWNGSLRARQFYAEQQRLWVELLLKFLPIRSLVEDVLQSFQGAVLAYLVTGDPEPGRRALMSALKSVHSSKHSRRKPMRRVTKGTS